MNTARPRREPGRGYAYGGPDLIGGTLVGLGRGILLDGFFAWLVIGIGAGFILMGFIAVGPWRRLQASGGAGILS
jgi:hypothetical protein